MTMTMTMFLLIGTVVYVFVHILNRHAHKVAASEYEDEELFYSGDSQKSRWGRKNDWDDANFDEDGDWDPLDDHGLEDSTMENALQSQYDGEFDRMIAFMIALETGVSADSSAHAHRRASQNR